MCSEGSSRGCADECDEEDEDDVLHYSQNSVLLGLSDVDLRRCLLTHFGALRNLRLLHLARFEVHDSDLSRGSIWFTSEDIVYLYGEGNTNTSAVVGDTLDAIGNLTYVLKRLLVGHTIVLTHPSRSNVWNLAAPAPSTPGRPGPRTRRV